MNNAAFLWIGSLLRCSKIKAEWNDAMEEGDEGDATRRSPLFASLATSNIMLKMFDGKASKLIAYADDVAIIAC